MLLEISTTHRPAGDLVYLLHKHPGRVQTFKQAFGDAHVFYPELTGERCVAALLIDVGPVGLVRGKGGAPNREYNLMWEALAAGAMRHRDHGFEWTREQFRAWAAGMCARFKCACEFLDVGEPGGTADGNDIGSPTQMGVFSRA